MDDSNGGGLPACIQTAAGREGVNMQITDTGKAEIEQSRMGG